MLRDVVLYAEVMPSLKQPANVTNDYMHAMRCALPIPQSSSVLASGNAVVEPPYGATPRTWAAFCRLLDDIEAGNCCSEQERRVVGVSAFGSYGSLEVVMLVTDEQRLPLRIETRLISASMV